MFNILDSKSLARPALIITALLFLLAADGCYYFRVNRSTEPASDEISQLQSEKKFFILHIDDNVWHLTDIVLNDDTVKGTISMLLGHDMYKKATLDAPNRYRPTNMLNKESQVLNEVHIYITAMIKTGGTTVSIPVKAITRINIYDKASGATFASWAFTGLGVIAGTAGVVIGIIFLTKDSCPFVYAHNGNEFVFTGEVFSGAVQPKLERDDYLLLPSIVPVDGTYKVKITNEVKEIQSLNFAELLVIDHPSDNSVLIDKNGIPYSLGNPSPPVVARGTGNCDILPLIVSKDSVSYIGNEKEIDKTGLENIVLKFNKPEGVQSSRLIIRAKNSFWLEGLLSRTDKLFGEKYNTYWSKQEKEPGEKMQKWLLDQKMPLSVYIERDNNWEFVDYFNIAGPMALKDDVLPLDLAGINSDTIKIKLVTGFLFWEIDYAAMDFNIKNIILMSDLPVKSATDNNNTDVRELILNSDQNYYVLDEINDESLLIFDAPPQKEPCQSVFLHTRGYYKIIREQSGKPDRKTLRTFRKPDRYPEFSKEMFDSLSARRSP